MHPRCRSTISAVISEGARVARVRGKSIRVPADMSYGDYKKIYVEKSTRLTLNLPEFNGSQNGQSHSVRSKISTAKDLATNIIRPENPAQLNALFKKFVTAEYFELDSTLDRPLAYSSTYEKVLFNPSDKNWSRYNLAEAVAHETVHLIDFYFGISVTLAPQISRAVDEAKAIIQAKRRHYEELLLGDLGKNMSVSDLVSAITDAEIHGYFAHDKTYWAEMLKRELEIVANLMTIYYTDDAAGREFIWNIPALKKLYEEVKARYVRITE